jgi:hypothetical protein
MFWIFKKTPKVIPKPLPQPTFDIPYYKLYEAEGKNEGLTLTADEVAELLDYIQYMTWLTNPPKKR